MVERLRMLLLACFSAALLLPLSGHAQPAPSSADVAWRLLDYLSVDYAGAVSNGQVISPSEYAEMKEFSVSVRDRIAALPDTAAKPKLSHDANALVASIEGRANPEAVAPQARALGAALLAAYPVPLAPKDPPDLKFGEHVYVERCVSCHGAAGNGDGPNAKRYTPRPIAFSNLERARQRSVFGLYQVITQGLDGTAMPTFGALSDKERWAVAFYVSRFAFDDAAAKAGEQLWAKDATLRARLPNLQAVVQTTPALMAAEIGDPEAMQVSAYLRRHPEAILPKPATSLDIARTKLGQSLSAYEAGDAVKAEELALAAYLDGFEPVEPALTARDKALMTRVETAMGNLRAAITNRAPAGEVRMQVDHLLALLSLSERALNPENTSNVSSFAGAFAILLREGLEALLIVVAMIAFLRKAERPELLRYVHGGWVGALAAGGLTWLVATFAISISGASRELTEGFGSLLSAVVLISVGVWMHGKGHADAWQAYIKGKLTAALSKRSAWFLFLLAFIVVYREVFETILFYAALWSQGAQAAMLAGAGVAVLLLAAIAWALLNYSKRLPISKFFSYSSMLIAVLAVVLTGKGVAALQEAGLLDVLPLKGVPRIEILGLFPTAEGISAQAITLVIILVGFWISGRKASARPAG